MGARHCSTGVLKGAKITRRLDCYLHSNLAMFLPTWSKRKPLGLQVFDPQPDDPDECGSGYWKDVGVFESQYEPHDVEQQYSFERFVGRTN